MDGNPSSAAARNITKEDVIGKIRDEGDFDRLRLKIIRELKDNEELRSNISSIVKQSKALNRAGAEKMKPRQLSNAIFEEVGNQVMGELSDGLRGIMKTGGMKDEISETVRAVYDKLSKHGGERAEPSTNVIHARKKMKHASSISITTDRKWCTSYDNGQIERLGFDLSKNHNVNYPGKQNSEAVDSLVRCGKGKVEAQKVQPCDGSDDDPDVPPECHPTTFVLRTKILPRILATTEYSRE